MFANSDRTIDTEQLKREHPVAEVIARYGVQLRQQGRSLMGRCPFHDDRHPSFSVSPEKGLWFCFVCGIGGDAISFVMEIENVDFLEACEILAGGRLPALSGALPAAWTKAAQPRPPRELSRVEKDVLELAAKVYHTTLVAGPKDDGSPYGYLLKRGLAVETIQEFQFGYCSGDMLETALGYLRIAPEHAESVGLLWRKDEDRPTWEFLRGRITFVERDRDGRVVHMGGRDLAGQARRKYLFLADVDKPLYGLARLDRARPAFVVEAFFDYVTLWQWGYQAVAVMGTHLKPEHVERLAKVERLVFVPQNDEPNGEGKPTAAEMALARWQEALGEQAVLRLPGGVKDVNDLAQQEGGEETFHRLVGESEGDNG
jgi:DNA primase